ncbi:MAG: sigma-70 family RNA polymerase sigma factor [Bacteroidales bacterium]|nr:sigma-70 family RNA polymerase sigma factor [Bacteroidales bacterium]
MSFNEQEILAKLQDPSTQRRAFAEVVNQYSETLYWQIRRMVVDHEDANDVLQNTLVKAWTSIGSFRGEAKLSTWLFRIAYHESLTFLEHKKQNISIDDVSSEVSNQLESDPYFDGDETQAMLQAAIETLPAKQKAVFNMKYFEEKTYEEISAITGTSVGALKASYHIAIEKISHFFDTHD